MKTPNSVERESFRDIFISGCKDMFTQIGLMIHLRLKLAIRSPITSILRLIYPGLVILALWGVTRPKAEQFSAANPPITDVSPNIPKCNFPSDCITLVYSPFDDPFVYSIINAIASKNNPALTVAPMGHPNASGFDVIGFPSAEAMWNYTIEYPLGIQAGISFDESPYPNYEFANSSMLPYVIWVYKELQDPMGLKTYFFKDFSYNVQVALDSAIMKIYTNQDVHLNVSYRDLPFYSDGNEQNPEESNMLFGYIAPAFFFLAFYQHCILVISAVSYDRASNLRLGMKMMGLNNFPYWFSIIFMEMLFAVLESFVMIGVGFACKLPFFTNTNFATIFLLLWLSCIALATYGLFTSSWIQGKIKSIVFNIFMFLVFILLLYFPIFNLFDKTACFFVFPFDIYIAVDSIATLALPYLNTDGDLVKGPGFHWANMTEDIFKTPLPFTEPKTMSVSETYSRLFVCSILAFVFSVYLDTVWPGEFGIPQRIWFFALPNYWGLGKAESLVEVVGHDNTRLNSVLADLDPDVNREYQNTMSQQKSEDSNTAIRILKLSKTYSKGSCRSAQDQRALDFLTLSANKGTTLCILGHNGAGKTTAINCLTGVQLPSFGDAFIFEKSIMSEMSQVRRMTGVCPQHDILWPELTAIEHVRMFAKLKGVPSNKIEEEVQQKLKEVGLDDVGNQKAITFSGGMKRRLSVAISSIGDPKIIFMDEPTSGLDPKNRRQIWNMVQELKKNRVIVLTTHSMEEADVLGDKIAIMALGRLRAVGTPLHLKQRFGVGYHINLVVDPEKTQQVNETVRNILPEIVLDTDTAGNLSYSLAKAKIEDVSKFFEFVEREVQSKADVIRDWGISQTTMEEVFLRITHGDYNRGPGGAVGFYTGGTQEEKQQLNVRLEGSDEPLGFIFVEGSTVASEIRKLISGSIPSAPKAFQFLLNGIVVSPQQEQSVLCSNFLPVVTLRPIAIPSTKVEVNAENLSSENKSLQNDKEMLEQEVLKQRHQINDLNAKLQKALELLKQHNLEL